MGNSRRFGIMNFDDLEIDENFLNQTEDDFFIIFLDGTVKRALTCMKTRAIQGKSCIHIGKLITKNLKVDLEDICSYNYLLNDNEYASAWQCKDKIPTEGHPIVYLTDSVTMIIMRDDKWSREKLSNVDPKAYALSLLNEKNGEPSFSEADISYINLSNHDLYMATNGTIVKLPCFDKSNEADRLRMNEIISNNGLRDVYESFHRSYEIVISFAKTSEGDVTFNGRARAKALMFEKGDYGSEYPLRPKDFENDLMMFFYSWEAADHFIKTTKNSTNYVIKTAANYFDEDKEAAVQESKVENKKNMIAVAKVSAAMIGTGVVFAGTKLLFDLIVNKKKTGGGDGKEVFRRIMTGIGIRNSLQRSGAKLFTTGAMLSTASRFGGFLGGAAACAGGIAALASPMGIALGIVTAAVGTVKIVSSVAGGVVGGVAEAITGVADGLLEAVEDIPVIGHIVKGVKFVASKAWDGLCWVGSKIKDGFSWIGDKIGGFFSNLFGI